jgi:hypothetical protein
MLNRIVTAIEPFALTVIILAGASLAGWVKFVNASIIGIVAVFCGLLLVINHVAKQVATPNIKKKSTKE